MDEEKTTENIKLIKGKTMMFNICYLCYNGYDKKQILIMTGYPKKNVNECVWRYRNCGNYKPKIEKYLQQQQ